MFGLDVASTTSALLVLKEQLDLFLGIGQQLIRHKSGRMAENEMPREHTYGWEKPLSQAAGRGLVRLQCSFDRRVVGSIGPADVPTAYAVFSGGIRKCGTPGNFSH